MKKIITIALITTMFIPAASAQESTKLLKTKANKAACKNIKENYKSDTMAKWVDGLASDYDLISEIESNINIINKKQKFTSSKIKNITSSWINIEKNTKSALLEKNIKEFSTSINSKAIIIKNFDKICKSIES